MTKNLSSAFLLAPCSGPQPEILRSTTCQTQFDSFLTAAQQLRANVYLADGAIRSNQIDAQGRFVIPGDSECWHFLLVDSAKSVIGCSRYRIHPNTVRFEDLRVSRSTLATDPIWGNRLRTGMEDTIRNARERKFHFVEVGGWALADAYRGTKAALETLLASYVLSQLFGGCISTCIATVRHGSSAILRKIGAYPLSHLDQPMPVYMDPEYDCDMEVLCFDSEIMESRFANLVSEIKADIIATPIIKATQTSSDAQPERLLPAPVFAGRNDFETNVAYAY